MEFVVRSSKNGARIPGHQGFGPVRAKVFFLNLSSFSDYIFLTKRWRWPHAPLLLYKTFNFTMSWLLTMVGSVCLNAVLRRSVLCVSPLWSETKLVSLYLQPGVASQGFWTGPCYCLAFQCFLLKFFTITQSLGLNWHRARSAAAGRAEI